MIDQRLLQGALCAGLLWSAADLLRVWRLGLLRLSSPLRWALFSTAHAGLCAGAALLVGLIAAAPLVRRGGAAWLRLWCAALAALAVGAGTYLTYRITPPWVLPSILPLCLVFWLLGAEPIRALTSGGRAGARPALLCALCAVLAAGLNGRLLPMRVSPFQAAVLLVGLGLTLLAAVLALPRPGRWPALALAALLGSSAAVLQGDEEVRHALFLMEQDSRAVLWGLGRASGLGGASGAGAAIPARAAPPPPAQRCGERLVDRVLIVTIDTLRADHLRAYGYRRETAPHLSALAARAVLFERAYSLFPQTWLALRRLFAVERAGGREVSRLGPALDGAGVRRFGVLPAFLLERLGAGVVDLFAARATAEPGLAIDRELGQKGVAALGSPSAPQLLWVHLYAPHAPYHAYPADLRFGRRPIDRYDSAIGESDRALGRLLEAAARSPLGERTAIIVTGDHGEEFEEHGSLGHNHYGIFEEEIRVPLLIAAPGVAQRRAPEQVSHEDLAPTLLALLGACDPGLRGRSLLPALRGEPLPPDVIVTGPLPPYGTGALIDGRWKLAYSLFSRSTALYDPAADPAERRSLLHLRPEVAARLRARLLSRLAAAPGDLGGDLARDAEASGDEPGPR